MQGYRIDMRDGAECARDGTLFRDPARPVAKRNIRRAIHHFRKLVEDKEDTEQVFHIYDALPSKSFIPRARSLTLSERGERLRLTEGYLPDLLDDHETLRKTPKGSVAHAYCDFMESEGLTAAGLVAEAKKMGRPEYGDLIEWFGFRQRDTHDLMHVLTGYGRDALGEQCVLLFTHGQSPSPGHLLLGYAGAINMKKRVKSKAPVMRAVREAHRLGRNCPPLVRLSIRELLELNLEDAREALGIARPRFYERCHSTWRIEGIDPYDLLAPKAA
ncbi:ubiquinone biosynthesis protein COQ4 [Qipengyuania aquimaris]|uniref:Ubiquinone biosynthesis protein COQ4 n=2 Tax=Qipengyuania aquimaris TaxID=255984 RepID=A0A9Q3XBW1_9SPHN|nr:ubiquinone biosynthesis protein COQ4 [Qipengyuania aquimaris]